LSRQLRTVRADETFKRSQATAALGFDPGGALAEQQALARTTATRRSIESGLGGARSDERLARNDREAAEHELAASRTAISDLKTERRRAEIDAANAIRDALHDQLKNKSNIEKGLDKTQQAFRAAGEFLSAVARGDFETVVRAIREAIADLEKILFVLSVVVLVASAFAVLLAPITKGASLVLAAKLAKVAFLIDKIGTIIGLIDLALMATQAANGWKDPRIGRVPTAKDLATAAAWIGVSIAAGKAGSTAQGHFKRALFPDGRRATGFWRHVRIASPGKAVPPGLDRSLKSIAKGGIVGIEKAKKVHEDFEKLYDLLSRRRSTYQNGAAVPYAGDCYVR